MSFCASFWWGQLPSGLHQFEHMNWNIVYYFGRKCTLFIFSILYGFFNSLSLSILDACCIPNFQCHLRQASLAERDAFAFLKADSHGDYITYSSFCQALHQVLVSRHLWVVDQHVWNIREPQVIFSSTTARFNLSSWTDSWGDQEFVDPSRYRWKWCCWLWRI